MQRSNCAHITERLACRVKGLTALFCILLLTIVILCRNFATLADALWRPLEHGRRMAPSSDTGAAVRQRAETRLVTAGRDTKAQHGFVNPPVVRGSTVLYPTAEDLHAHRGEFQYGRHGTPTTKALREALMALEGPQCAGVGLAPSGLAAITTALLAVLKSGDHLLVCDNAYRPTRNFCNGLLARYGVETTYFDPLIGAGGAARGGPGAGAGRGGAPGARAGE